MSATTTAAAAPTARRGPEIRWELLLCPGCGGEHVRERGRYQTAMPCLSCGGAKQVLSVAVVDELVEILRGAGEQQRIAAQGDPDIVRRARREGRAEAFAEAIDLLTASDQLRTPPPAAQELGE